MLGNAPFCSQFFAAEKLKEMLLDRRGVQGGGGYQGSRAFAQLIGLISHLLHRASTCTSTNSIPYQRTPVSLVSPSGPGGSACIESLFHSQQIASH